jgi:hypothetical protein
MACLLPAVGLRQIATEIIRLVLLRPSEVGITGIVRLAIFTLARVDPLHAKLDTPLPINIVNSTEAKLFYGTAARLDSDGACERHQITPRDFVSEFGFDLTQQAPSLVQVCVITPLVLRPMTLSCTLTSSGRFTFVVNQPEAPGAMPRQTAEEACIARDITVLGSVGRPALLRVPHQTNDGVVETPDVQIFQFTIVFLLVQNRIMGGYVSTGRDGPHVVERASAGCRGEANQ